MGKRSEAYDLYTRSITEGKIMKESFIEIMTDDIELMVSLGIDKDDIPIIVDSLLYRLEKE
jgi:hypothetical protein